MFFKFGEVFLRHSLLSQDEIFCVRERGLNLNGMFSYDTVKQGFIYPLG